MTGRVCLIVDDESSIRECVAKLAALKGFQSIEAESAVTALQILRRLGSRIDLLITDIQMPGGIDGIDLAHSVKNSFKTLPIILISGNRLKAPAGFIFVQKPFGAGAIWDAIDRTMQQSEAENGRPEVPKANRAGA